MSVSLPLNTRLVTIWWVCSVWDWRREYGRTDSGMSCWSILITCGRGRGGKGGREGRKESEIMVGIGEKRTERV